MSSSNFAIFCIILFSLASLHECTNVEGLESSKLNFPPCLKARCPWNKKSRCYCCRGYFDKLCESTEQICEARCIPKA
ncbi:hypothetical protein EUTSA_v10010877mg [Eutrema salsugineum]|uniref:Embryo surrounding factor 1 brassicaceae domain-containing protein n=1 Tax=Eutrema salsugineum TaxID=72664 RepID=V4NHY0_EUTSA|nr:hypothetical protein EUTSA_v10010877mg [Eutrema salsugineum]